MQVSPHTARALRKAVTPGEPSPQWSVMPTTVHQPRPPSRYAPAAGRLLRRVIPLFAAAEGAPAGRPAVICFPSAYRFIKLSRDQAPDGRQRRFRPGHVALSAPLQSGVRFFHPPARAPPTAPLTGCLPLAGRGYAGYRVPRKHPRSLGLTRTPVAQHLRARTLDPRSWPLTFWSKPPAPWACSL